MIISASIDYIRTLKLKKNTNKTDYHNIKPAEKLQAYNKLNH